MTRAKLHFAVWLALGFYVLLLSMMLTDFRAVMGDEAAYADPALRWCEGRGFTSTAWEQSPGEFWASNLPLYAVSLIAWVKVTGLDSLWGLRFFSLLLFVAGLVMWMVGSRRAGWLGSPAQQAGFLALVVGSLYATAPSQYIRPESLGVFLLGFAVWGQTLRGEGGRVIAAAVTGFAAAWTGLQFVVALGLFGLVWLLLAPRKPWRPVIFCALGGAVGLVLLFAIYVYHGVLGTFLGATFGAASNRMAQWHGWRDPMLWAASVVLGGGVAVGLWPRREQRWAWAGLLAGPGLAAVLFALSKFPQYYGVLAILPVCTAVAAVFPVLSRPLRAAGIVFFGLAVVLGFPLSALMNWNMMPGRQHADVDRWMNSVLVDSRTAFVDPSVYFAARSPQREIYTQFVLPALLEGERKEIEVVVLSPQHSLVYLQPGNLLAQLGGEWERVAVFPPDETLGPRFHKLEFLSRFSYAGAYRFEAWRRNEGDAGKRDDKTAGTHER